MTRPLALITGATRGIGAAIADALAPTHRLAIGGTHRDAVMAVCDRHEGAIPFIGDVRDSDAMAAAIDTLPGIDVLVHNAGVSAYYPVAEAPRDEWQRVLEINVIAVAEITRLALPKLRAAHGQVITINSGAGFGSGPGEALYSASKHALRAFTDALREEERGVVRVTSIHPGRVDTDLQRRTWEEKGLTYVGGDHMDPVDIAATVKLAVEIGKAANIDFLSVRPAVQRNPT